MALPGFRIIQTTLLTEWFYILLMRAYPHPHKVGNEGSGSAQALTVYCNEYGKLGQKAVYFKVIVCLEAEFEWNKLSFII